jgi:hypothetical protein
MYAGLFCIGSSGQIWPDGVNSGYNWLRINRVGAGYRLLVGFGFVGLSIWITLLAVSGWFDFIHTENVSQKDLHRSTFSYYNNYMANVLPIDKQITVVSSLCEGSMAAIERAFGEHNVGYGQIIKTYGKEESIEQQRRYSAPKITESEKKGIFGYPDWDFISTSYVERLNATTRLHMKRLTRLTHAFSKKRENSEAAVGLHFAYYNFVRRHNTLRCTPAMAAGVEQSFWSVGDLVEACA